MSKPRLLDLFSGAGGAAMGYARAGFEVVGVDIAPQKHYPFEFHQADALEYCAEHGKEFDVIHASPPCQGYSVTKSINLKAAAMYPKLIETVRNLLIVSGKPYVIENVPGAPLLFPIVLCGLHFGLRVWRHRWFETNPWMLSPPHNDHPKGSTTKIVTGFSSFERGATHISMVGHCFRKDDAILALNGDCDWMSHDELAEAIPPPYTEYIGKQLIAALF